jgi:hypothetical protein
LLTTTIYDWPCVWCREQEVLEIADIWSGHEFSLETCCLARHEQVVAEMADDPEWATELLRQLGAEALTGHRLRRLYDDRGSTPVLDYRLDVRPVAFATMRDFVRRYHRHCAPPVTWRFGASIWNGWTLIGVVSVGNPVAAAYMHRGWVEVNRLCVRHDLAPQLAWNACSQLYGYAAREAERRGFSKIITYVREDEDGTSLRAAGWTCEGAAGGRSWNRVSRRRNTTGAFVPKLRWSRQLRPRPARTPAPSVARARTRQRAAWMWLQAT